MRTIRGRETMDEQTVAFSVAALSTDTDARSEANVAATSAVMRWVGAKLNRKARKDESEQQSPKPPAKDGLSLEWLSAEQRGGGRPGRWYYWNAKTRESSWADPIQPVESDDGAAAAGQPARAAGSPGMAGL
jgi:hypothetical protein